MKKTTKKPVAKKTTQRTVTRTQTVSKPVAKAPIKAVAKPVVKKPELNSPKTLVAILLSTWAFFTLLGIGILSAVAVWAPAAYETIYDKIVSAF